MWITGLLLGCTSMDDTLYEGPTGEGNDIFCSSYDDADAIEMMELSSLQGSGRLKVQLIIDDEDNPKDGDIIGNAEYRLSNEQISGAEQQGTMSPLGEFTKTLGPGVWTMTVNGSEGCLNKGPNDEGIEVVIEEGIETYMCIPLYCD